MAMWWLFSINIGTKEVAERFAKTFDLGPVSIDEQSHPLHPIMGQQLSEYEGEWYLNLTPQSNKNPYWGEWVRGNPSSTEEAIRMTAVGNNFFDRLRKTNEPFIFATVGVECMDWRTSEEVIELLHDYDYHGLGLAVSQELWERGGKPSQFVIFKDGYMWDPWDGEKFPQN